VRNQFDNLINSKQAHTGPGATVLVWGLVAGVALAAIWASLQLPAPLTGRLHPGLVPGALGLICLAAVLVGAVWQRQATHGADCLPTTALPARAILATVAAVTVLALGVRTLGVLPAAFAAATLAALGVRAVVLTRAALTGAGIAVLVALLFVVGLRQPLPLLPGVW
jgi:hypothetical protein